MQADLFPTPRDFQNTAHDLLRQGFRDGHKNQMIMAPTGGGKTYLGLRIISEALKRGKRAVFLCDRTTLINQTSATADVYGLKDHAIIQANHPRRDITMPFQIASAQTLDKRGYWPAADIIVIDEAHTQMKVWTEYIQNTPAACIGLSATPFSRGLGKLFTNLINAATMNELTKLGVLVPMRVMSCTRPDMTGAKTSGGEWTDKAAEERGMAIIGDVVTEWLRHAENRKTIVFGSTIYHCQELARQFLGEGVMAAVFTSETTAKEREVLLEEYRKPNSMLRVLISVEALAKGFDVPDVECVVDCRPLRKSLSTAVQMWGRGLRSFPGKIDCLMMDHSGNIIRFAPDFTEVYFDGLKSLDTGDKLDSAVRQDDDYIPKGCPACGYKPFHKRCMSCGYERQPPALISTDAGEMQDVEIFVGKRKLAENYVHLWQQAVTYARIHSQPDKQQGRAYHLFKKMTGMEPSGLPSFHNVADVQLTNKFKNKVTSLNMAYKKASGRHAVR